MKKMLICCGVLCMTLLLFCGTAFAAVTITPGSDTSVTVTANTDGKSFTVTKTGVTDGQLYLVMIQKGDASAKPTADNLYYLDVEKVSGTTLTLNNVYPKDLDGGDYVVFLSDYASSSGGRKAVATLKVQGGGICGDVNGDGVVNVKDRGILARYLAKWPEYGPDKTDDSHKVVLDNSDVNQDGNVNVQDRGILARHLAKWPEYATLPMPKS